MKRMQILFPDPLIKRLKEQAELEDRAVSEVIRRAAEFWLDRVPSKTSNKKLRVPLIDGGSIKVESSELRNTIYEES